MRAEVFAEAGGAWERRGGRDFQLHRALDEPRTFALAEGAPARRWRVRFLATENPPWIPRRDIPVRSFALGNAPLAGSRAAIAPDALLDLGDAVRDGAIRAADRAGEDAPFPDTQSVRRAKRFPCGNLREIQPGHRHVSPIRGRLPSGRGITTDS